MVNLIIFLKDKKAVLGATIVLEASRVIFLCDCESAWISISSL